MKDIAIVTDGAASVPAEVLQKYDIASVPLWIQLGEKSYKQDVDIDNAGFYGLLEGDAMPTTSSPAPTDFIETYKRLAKKAKHIISVHIDGQSSATCQVARIASQAVKDLVKVHVYDSKAVTMGIGFLALEAARAAKEGLKADEIICKLDSIRKRIRTFVAVPTLKYLAKSGRVRKGQAILASILSIKPILEIGDGEIGVAEHVRSFTKAVTRTLELAQRSVGNLPSMVAIMHTNAPELAQAFAEKVRAKINVKELLIGEAGPILGVHSGPGVVGIVLYPSATQ